MSVAIHLATSRNDADHALSLEFIATIVPGQSKSPVLHQLAGIMRHWAAEVGITAAFVSEDPRDDGSRTYHERSNNLPALVTWDAVQEHVRGVFWGMALGSALCDRLGGQGAVLASAPSVIREPLGGGVWLQLTPDPPAPPQSYRQMREYLSSLLTWPAPPRPHPSLTEPVVPTVSLPPSDGPAVPIQWLDTDEGDAAINVYLSPPLTDAAEMAIVSAVNSWYDAGFYGAFGDAGFHWLNEPSVDHSSAVIRWMLDPGSANITMAMEVLARWLAAIPNNPVRELVVGTEVVG